MIGNSFNYKTVLVAAAAIVTLSGAWGVLSALEIRPVFLGEHLRDLKKIKTVHVIDLKVLGSDFYSSLIKKKKYDLYDLQQYRNKKLRQAFDSGWTQAEIHPSIDKDIIKMQEQIEQLEKKRQVLEKRK